MVLQLGDLNSIPRKYTAVEGKTSSAKLSFGFTRTVAHVPTPHHAHRQTDCGFFKKEEGTVRFELHFRFPQKQFYSKTRCWTVLEPAWRPCPKAPALGQWSRAPAAQTRPSSGTKHCPYPRDSQAFPRLLCIHLTRFPPARNPTHAISEDSGISCGH